MNRLLVLALLTASLSLSATFAHAAETMGGELWTADLRIRTIATELDRGKWNLQVTVLERESERPLLYRAIETYTGRTKDLSAQGLDGREYRFSVSLFSTSLEMKVEVRDGGEPVEYFESRFETVERAALTAIDPSETVLHVGGRVSAPELILKVEPKYPEEARQYRVSGIVVLEATINEEGTVTKTRIVRGLPFGLNEAAEEAVMKWKFKPATMDGEPVKVAHRVTVEFNVHRAGDQSQ